MSSGFAPPANNAGLGAEDQDKPDLAAKDGQHCEDKLYKTQQWPNNCLRAVVYLALLHTQAAYSLQLLVTKLVLWCSCRWQDNTTCLRPARTSWCAVHWHSTRSVQWHDHWRVL